MAQRSGRKSDGTGPITKEGIPAILKSVSVKFMLRDNGACNCDFNYGRSNLLVNVEIKNFFVFIFIFFFFLNLNLN